MIPAKFVWKVAHTEALVGRTLILKKIGHEYIPWDAPLTWPYFQGNPCFIFSNHIFMMDKNFPCNKISHGLTCDIRVVLVYSKESLN